tara:strand:- start:185 stop:811 length:627 start_codon:yes stop_codon:yes gene_type:complete
MISKIKKYNLNLVIIYIIVLFTLCVGILIYVDFSINKILDKSYLLEQSLKLDLLVQKNFIFFSVFYCITFIVFVSIIPFTLPLIFLTSIIYNPIIGAFISTICITLGSIIFFLFFIKSNLVSLFDLKKLKTNKIILKLKKNELISIFIFRITGGGGMPLVIQNIILFYSNVSLKNFFVGTLFGILPGNLLLSILGIGIFEALKLFVFS